MLQIPQQNMFSVQFPHSQAIVFFFLYTQFLFFSNAQGGNEKKGSREKQPETDFFFQKRSMNNSDFYFTARSEREKDGERKRRGRERQREVNDVKEFIYIFNPLRTIDDEQDGEKKLFFKHIRNSRHTLLYLLQSKLTENCFFLLLFLVPSSCLLLISLWIIMIIILWLSSIILNDFTKKKINNFFRIWSSWWICVPLYLSHLFFISISFSRFPW